MTECVGGYDQAIAINEACRAKEETGFILCENQGLAGYIFLDFGKRFSIRDKDGEDPKNFIVTNITQANPAIVTVHEDKRHKY